MNNPRAARAIFSGLSLAVASVFAIDLFVRQPDWRVFEGAAERTEFYKIQLSLADWSYRQNVSAIEYAVALMILAVAVAAATARRWYLAIAFSTTSAVLLIFSHTSTTGRQWLFEFGSAPWPVWCSALLTAIFAAVALLMNRRRKR